MRWAVVGGWWAKVEVGHCCCSWQFGAFTVTYSYTWIAEWAEWYDAMANDTKYDIQYDIEKQRYTLYTVQGAIVRSGFGLVLWAGHAAISFIPTDSHCFCCLFYGHYHSFIAAAACFFLYSGAHMQTRHVCVSSGATVLERVWVWTCAGVRYFQLTLSVCVFWFEAGAGSGYKENS